MTFRARRFFPFTGLILSLFFSQSCSMTIESPGIPVKSNWEPAAIVDMAQRQQQEMAEEIARMSNSSGNSVFTERNGFPEYLIGPGDVLAINYWTPSREEAFKQSTYTTTVRPDGKISFVFGDDIVVGNLTASEARQSLVNMAQKYMREPRIEVQVKEYKSKVVVIAGQINVYSLAMGVSGPGRYGLTGKSRVLDMISLAGGPVTGKDTGNADLRNVELVRAAKKYTLNLYNAMFRGDVSDNVVVDNGDIITIPVQPTFAERIYIFGQVNSQGVLRLRDAQDLLAAIALSGGMTKVAIRTDVKIIRDYVERKGKPLILSANVNEILMQGDLAQNIRLKDGDVIYVPRSVIGDINEFIDVLTPSLDFLYNRPSGFRANYLLDQNALRW